VAGSDLIYAISQWSSERRYRLFFLGGAPGVAHLAATRLQQRYPELKVVGTESPPFRPLSTQEESGLVQRIRGAAPDILFVALGQPKGELWLARNCDDLNVPVSVQLGASFDFVAGTSKRSPRWIQRLGMEWFYRLAHDPSRLSRRYAQNAAFLAKAILAECADAVVPSPS
jgi:N-acetylglucosaminyldiphosphoundecaprenol N-acetyl-beta-D-mannosaminyltransferase